MRAAELLEVLENDTIVFNNNTDIDYLMDFAIYEKWNDGKSQLLKFIEKYDNELHEEERIVIAAMKDAETSLFEVVDFDREQKTVCVKDLFNDEKRIEFIDIGLSSSIDIGTLLFTRLIKFDSFNMTSGTCFTFLGDHKHFIIRKSKKLMKKMNSGDLSADRFITFFKLNETDGIPILFKEVN
ncbi:MULTISPECIES: hypothetical protein [unclassified Fusibacter]|uniref:hypothetical protein n=1 Tax=unclassified Fusibacter TaxID=2624464 RepID=UPI001010E1C4|nr:MULTISPECIES: hypothetical protein [unclassified Fusibacter]MCK8058164.1 hypothetical protein [Fusibacter sp. A2]NPE20747.1 hypothetical protein [Fusibacter sp. A1]RXV62954.1 hypothetical protein DWB64_02870 [Fusibacter sp. A1]